MFFRCSKENTSFHKPSHWCEGTHLMTHHLLVYVMITCNSAKHAKYCGGWTTWSFPTATIIYLSVLYDFSRCYLLTVSSSLTLNLSFCLFLLSAHLPFPITTLIKFVYFSLIFLFSSLQLAMKMRLAI